MGKTLILACVLAAGVGGCRPMYGDPPVHLKNPPSHPRPTGWDAEPVADVHYVDECNVDFRAPPTTKRQTKVAEQKVIAGDTAVDSLKPDAKDDLKVAMTKRSIEQYREALLADPYNAQATLKLALAYDKVLRKGCALAMLKRLDQLAANPKLGADAAIGQVVDNEQWFKPYRIDALRAIGH